MHPFSARPAGTRLAPILTALALPLAAAVACAQDAPAPPAAAADAPAAVAFVGVHVVPMDDEHVLRDQTVVVRAGRIAAVGPAATTPVPDDALRVEAAGRYLMPGLAEMHGHIPGAQDPRYADDVMFLYVSNGVTTVRGMLGHAHALALRERITRGELIGPTIYTAGPGFGGNLTPDAAEARVREQKDAGYDLLKVTGGSREMYERMARAADALGIRFAGHIPEPVGLTGALTARQSSIDHLDRYVEFLVPETASLDGRASGFFGSGVVDLADPARIAQAVAMTRDAGVWNVPTLSLVEHLASPEPAEQMARRPEMRYMPRGIVDGWVRSKHEFQARQDFQPAAAQRLVELRRQLTRALHDGGALLALGSDAPQFFNVPGFSIHPEMEMMVAAGLTPYQVLVTGTRNPALYFGVPEEFGTVQVGRRADLILLEANPLEDVANVRRRAGVMVRGRWMPETEIQQRLDAIAAANAGGVASGADR